MSYSKYDTFSNLDHAQQNQKLNRQIIGIKQELYQVYQENIKLRQVVKQMEEERQFYQDCGGEIERLKNMMKTANERRNSMPNEREEIKDRIIMKLEDQLINTKIELKETRLQLLNANRHRE